MKCFVTLKILQEIRRTLLLSICDNVLTLYMYIKLCQLPIHLLPFKSKNSFLLIPNIFDSECLLNTSSFDPLIENIQHTFWFIRNIFRILISVL